MRTLILAAALGAVAVGVAGPAAADDETFVGALEMIGVDVGGAAAAAAMGRSVCADLDRALTVPAVVARLSDQHGLTAEDAALVTGFSVAEYCDHHEGALQLGG